MAHPANLDVARHNDATPPFSARILVLVLFTHLAVLTLLMAPAKPEPALPAVLSARMVSPSAAMQAAAAPVSPSAPAKPVPSRQQPSNVRPASSQIRPAAAPALTTVSPSSAGTATMSDRPADPDLPATLLSIPSGSQTGGSDKSSGPGEALVAARFDAAYLQNPAPFYPAPARRRGEEGRVLLRVFVESSGLPGKVELHSSSGFTLLDQSALDAVGRWKFVPARRGSEAVPAWVVVPIVFNLRG